MVGQAMDKKTILALKLWLLGPFQILLSIKTMHVWKRINFFNYLTQMQNLIYKPTPRLLK